MPFAAEEFAGARFGDERLSRRLLEMAERLSSRPEATFPRAARSERELEGTYRFFNNVKVSSEGILEPHAQQTAERMIEGKLVLCAHDTTTMLYPSDFVRRGLGFVNGDDQGFLVHASLAISADDMRRPLGVARFAPWVRQKKRKRRNADGTKLSGAQYAKLADKESARWYEAVADVERRLAGRAAVIHLMDREADAFPLLSKLVEGESRFVIRLSQNRITADPDDVDAPLEHLFTRVEAIENLFDLDVPLTKRRASPAPNDAKIHKARESRVARLQFAATRVKIRRPRYLKQELDWLDVNVVRAWEPAPPAGQDPVEWLLVTTEPVATKAQILQVVQHYRARWLIEEFFKALKTGCAVENRQLESYTALVNMVAVFVPIAWQMLVLRSLGRTAPDEPASLALSEQQLEVLRAFSSRPLGEKPTIGEAMFAVARLGGHLKRNGLPGWRTLAAGVEELLTLEKGWAAAKRARGKL
jgi:hypothetical protein